MLNTWLPLPDFQESVKTLRMQELAMQRFHVLELMEYIHQVPEEDSELPSNYTRTDPDDVEYISLVLMWKGFELQLCEYGLTCCDEWMQRRSKRRDPMYEKIDFHLMCASNCEDVDGMKPNWFGDVDFHLSHQAALVRLDQKHYAAYFKVDTDRPLEWPDSKYI